tara:strand:- start:65 stop:199 length:135 start_codon:yes stop_codon:yes gene_type:complete
VSDEFVKAVLHLVSFGKPRVKEGEFGEDLSPRPGLIKSVRKVRR